MVEPFVIVYTRINHHETCNLLSTEEIEQHQFVRKIKDRVALQPYRPIQQIYESSVLEYLTLYRSLCTSINKFFALIIQFILKKARSIYT